MVWTPRVAGRVLLLTACTLVQTACVDLEPSGTESISPQELGQRIAFKRQQLEHAVGVFLDAVEADCLRTAEQQSAGIDSAECETGESRHGALKDLKAELKLYHQRTGAWEHTVQADTWRANLMLQNLRDQVHRKQPPVAEPVDTHEAHAKLQRFASDVPRTIFAVEHLAQCPATKKEGVVLSYYFANLHGREHINNPKEDAKYTRQLKLWSTVHAAKLGIKSVIVHDGIREDLLTEVQHPNIEFLHIDELPGLANTNWGSGVTSNDRAERSFIDSRYHVSLASIELLSKRDPTPEYVLIADFLDVAFDRNPFSWLSLLGDSFDVFINYETEGNIAWLLEQFRTCFSGNPGVKELGDALISGTMYNPGVFAGKLDTIRQLVEMFNSLLEQVGFDISQGYAGCDMAVVNRVMWDIAQKRTDKTWRVYGGPPFSAPFRWASFPDRDPWERVGEGCHYAYHK